MHTTFRQASVLCIALCVSMLESVPLRAADGPRKPRTVLRALGVGPIEFDGNFDADDQKRLTAGFAEGLERGRPGADPQAVESQGCGDDVCFAERMSAAAVSTLVYARVERRDRDFKVHVEARGHHGTLVTTISDTCEICGIDEAIEILASSSARLFERISRTDREGILILESQPSGALVRLGARTLGHTPLRAELEPGKHTVVLDKRGYGSASSTVWVEPGLETRGTIALLPTAGASAKTVGGSLVALGLLGIAGGITLLALDGRDHEGSCGAADLDAAGNCPNVYTTKWGGFAASVVGAAMTSVGITLLVRGRSRSTRSALAPHGMGLQGSF